MYTKLRALAAKTKGNTKVWTALAIGLIVGGTSSMAALASIPDADGKINACYSNMTGDVRIIDSPTASCGGGEIAIAWDQSAGVGGMLSDFTDADLTHAGLQLRNFKNVDFANATLVEVNFSGSDLRNADFTNTTLGGTSFFRANMTNADMSGNTYFNSVSFVEADVSGLDLTDATFGTVGGDLRSAILSNTTVAGLTDANMSGLNFSNGDIVLLPNAYLNGGEYEGTDFSGLTLDNTTFVETNLTEADFTGTIFTNGWFNNNETYLPGLTLTGADFTNAQFNGTYLAGADFSGTTLTGATWSNATCPDGTNSNSNGNTCIGHLVP
jgi:uncharacterized protein YjbI with pentapeptide repeats